MTVAKIAFSSLNHIDAATLSADVAEVAGLGLANLKTTAIQQPYRVNASAVTITIDYGRDVEIGVIAFAQPDRRPQRRASDPYYLLAEDDTVRHRLYGSEETTNLLTYSQEVDNAAWTKSHCSISADATTAPDGTTTADKLVEDSGNYNHQAYQFGGVDTAVHTGSVFAKAGERTSVQLQMFDADAPSNYLVAKYDLATGTVISSQAFGNAQLVGASIEPAENGFYRCILVGTPNTAGAGGTVRFDIATLDGTNSSPYTGDGASGLYIWGAQLEARATPSQYIPTSSAPVTDHVEVYDSGALASGVLPRFGYHYHQPPSAVTARSHTIEITAAARPWFDLGRLWAGPVWQPTFNISYGWHRRWVSGQTPGPRQGAKSLIQYVDEKERTRELALPFGYLSSADAEWLDDFLFDVGRFGQFLVCVDPDNPGRHTAFCRLVEEPPTVQRYFAGFEITHIAIESR